MYGGVFPEDVVIADFKIRRFARVLEILGFASNGGEGKKLVSPADPGVSVNDHMRVEDAVVADPDIRPDDAERANPDIFSERGKR